MNKHLNKKLIYKSIIFCLLQNYLIAGSFEFFDTKLILDIQNERDKQIYTPLIKNSSAQSLIIGDKEYKINADFFTFYYYPNKNNIFLHLLFPSNLPKTSGTRLLNIVFEVASTKNANKVNLLAADGSWGFYYKMGFRPQALLGAEYQDAVDHKMSLAMAKKLIESNLLQQALPTDVSLKLSSLRTKFEMAKKYFDHTYGKQDYYSKVIDELKEIFWQPDLPRLQNPGARESIITKSIAMMIDTSVTADTSIKKFTALQDRLDKDQKQMAIATFAKESFDSLQKKTYQTFLQALIPENYENLVDSLATQFGLKKIAD